jgi:hypothetical protein
LTGCFLNGHHSSSSGLFHRLFLIPDSGKYPLPGPFRSRGVLIAPLPVLYHLLLEAAFTKLAWSCARLSGPSGFLWTFEKPPGVLDFYVKTKNESTGSHCHSLLSTVPRLGHIYLCISEDVPSAFTRFSSDSG